MGSEGTERGLVRSSKGAQHLQLSQALVGLESLSQRLGALHTNVVVAAADTSESATSAFAWPAMPGPDPHSARACSQCKPQHLCSPAVAQRTSQDKPGMPGIFWDVCCVPAGLHR